VRYKVYLSLHIRKIPISLLPLILTTLFLNFQQHAVQMHGFTTQLTITQNTNYHMMRHSKKLYPHYFHYQKNGTVKPVETDTIKLIDTLQKNNIPTVALTARSKSIIDLTIKQLNSININLNKNHFANRTFTFKNTSCPSYLKNGVIFCGNNKKGEILRQFLKEVNMKPSLVIFIDDKRKYLEDVEANLTKISIPFLGFRYGYLDEKVKNFQFHESMLTIPA